MSDVSRVVITEHLVMLNNICIERRIYDNSKYTDFFESDGSIYGEGHIDNLQERLNVFKILKRDREVLERIDRNFSEFD